MFKVSPDQLSIDFDQPVDQTPAYDDKPEANDYLDRRADELADIGSYDEAYRILGIPRDNLNTAVPLDERAKLLLQSLDNFAAAAKADGHISGIVDNHPHFKGKYRDPEAVIDSLARKRNNFEHVADSELHRALGYETLKTMMGEEASMENETEDVHSFHQKILGPINQSHRNKLRVQLRRGVVLRHKLKPEQDS